MASTVLPNGIIIPEKYSRDWYNDLYHNWQELDNLLAGGGAGGGANDGTLTIQKNGATVGTFSANQATDETINIEVPDVNNGTLTIQQNGTTVDTFTANSSTDKTVNIAIPTKTSDLTNDSDFVQSSDLATVATSGSYNDLSNKPTIPTVNNATLTIQKNGTNVQAFTANQSTNATANIIVPTKTSDLTNDSGFITEDNTKIPLAGSNEISGSLIPATNNTYDLGSGTHAFYTINVGTYITYNGTALYFTSTSNNAGIVLGYDALLPSKDNVYALGSTTWRWSKVYAGSSAIITSDQRKKQQIKSVDDKLLDAWENVSIVQFKFNDSVEEKGNNARLHTGYIAQNIQQACEEKGVNPNDYGLFCHDEWEEQEEKKDENGQVIEPYRANGDLYSLRYEEALVVECMYLRRCIARLTARIEELEKGNNSK